DEKGLLKGTAGWLRSVDLTSLDLGITADDATRRAPEFLAKLRTGEKPQQVDDTILDLARASCHLIGESDTILVDPFVDAENLYGYLESAPWPALNFGERAELLTNTAFHAWRRARRVSDVPRTETWLAKFETASGLLPDQALLEAHERTAEPDFLQGVNRRRVVDLGLHQSDVYLSLCHILDSHLESAPSVVLAEAEYFYELLQEKESSAFNFLFDEHDYYRGEFAILAGTSCRMLGRREEAHDWFDRAEVAFLAT